MDHRRSLLAALALALALIASSRRRASSATDASTGAGAHLRVAARTGRRSVTSRRSRRKWSRPTRGSPAGTSARRPSPRVTVAAISSPLVLRPAGDARNLGNPRRRPQSAVRLHPPQSRAPRPRAPRRASAPRPRDLPAAVLRPDRLVAGQGSHRGIHVRPADDCTRPRPRASLVVDGRGRRGGDPESAARVVVGLVFVSQRDREPRLRQRHAVLGRRDGGLALALLHPPYYLWRYQTPSLLMRAGPMGLPLGRVAHRHGGRSGHRARGDFPDPNPLVDVRRPRNGEKVGINPPGFIWKPLMGQRLSNRDQPRPCVQRSGRVFLRRPRRADTVHPTTHAAARPMVLAMVGRLLPGKWSQVFSFSC